MEQYPQLWMSNPSAKGTLMESNYVVASMSSWEEEAFAEDAAGRFGGLVWPPRSYRCNFCGREFRSAQALGGHMNVHRKEKARINNNINQQSSSIPQNKEDNLGHNHHKNHCIRVNPSDCIKSTTTDSKEENEETLAPSSNSSIRFLNILGSKTEEECTNKKLKTADELPVSLNLDIGIGKERMLLAGYKRRRVEEVPLPIVIKAAIDDLDLELRLGDRPKVK